MIETVKQEVRFFYIIHGTIPEITPNVAFRRVDKAEQYARKLLKCPYCERRLSDMDADTRVELYRHPVHVHVHCQFYMKCAYCNSEVGINIV